MAMKKAQSPRRIYRRAGSFVLSIVGTFYGPRKGEKCKFDPKVEVTSTDLPSHVGKKRISVTQLVDGKDPVTETWIEREVTFTKREPKAGTLLNAAPEITVTEVPASEAAALQAIPVMEG